MNIFMKNLKFKSMCIISVLYFFVFLGSSVNAAAPTVVQPIPNQVAYNGEIFDVSFDIHNIFSDLDNEGLSIAIKQADDSPLPTWLTVGAKPIVPNLVGTWNANVSAFLGISGVGNYAYVADHLAGFKIIDTTNKANPNLVGTLNATDSAYGIAVDGNHAYVVNDFGGLQIIDITNKASPSLVKVCDVPGRALKVAVDGNYAYVAARDAGLQIIDIDPPSTASIVGAYDTTGWAEDVAVNGDYAYVADYDEGLKIIDISNKTSPSSAGSLPTTDLFARVTVVGNHAYVGGDADTGLKIFDISTPSSPSPTGSFDTLHNVGEVEVVGNYAYVANHYTDVEIVDISDKENPSLIGTMDTSCATEIAIVDDYAYVAESGYGLKIFEGVREGLRLSGTPDYDDIGVFNLEATASNDHGSVTTQPFSINVLESITNNKPTIIDKEYKKSQNASLRFNKEQFIAAFQDDDSDELSKIQIMSLPDYGELKLSGIAISLNQEIAVDDIDDLSFVPEKDWTGTTTFDWRGFDGTTYSDEGVVTIKINVADPDWLEKWWPVVTGGTVAVIGAGAAVVGGVTLWLCRRQLAKSCCADKPKEQLKKIEMDENEV